jgi:hypothetical protein
MKRDYLKKLTLSIGVLIVLVLVSPKLNAQNSEISEIDEVFSNITWSLGNSMRGENHGMKPFIEDINYPFLYICNDDVSKLSKKLILKSGIFDLQFHPFGFSTNQDDMLSDISKSTTSISSNSTYESLGVDKGTNVYAVDINQGIAIAPQELYRFIFGKVKGKYKLIALQTKNEFEKFFNEFQKAIKENNSEKVSSFMVFPVEGMVDSDWNPIEDRQTFLSNNDLSHYSELSNVVFWGTDIEYESDVEISQADGVMYTTSYSFTTGESSNTINFFVGNSEEDLIEGEILGESGVQYTFKKIDGSYKLVAIMHVG